MKVSFVYRFNISEIVFPKIAETISGNEKLNLISGQRLSDEFLNKKSELANKINGYIDSGELIPQNLWVPFFTSLWSNEKHNVFCGLVSNLEQFKLFESYFKERDIRINKIVYLKLTDVDKLISLAVEKYSKAYGGNSDSLRKRIAEYNDKIRSIIDYATGIYPIEVMDFFDTRINIE